MRLILIFICGLVVWSANAKVVVLSAPSADAGEYRAYVFSSPTHVFPSEYLLAQFPNPQKGQQMADHFARAQSSFAEGSLVQAIQEYRAVVAIATLDQWPETEQTALLYSYLRLAQLEGEGASDDWLSKAIVEAPLGKIDSKLYPPPILKRLAEVRQKVPVSQFSLRRFQNDFRYLIVNGRRIDLQTTETITLPNASMVLDLLSDIYQPVHVNLTATAFANWNPERRPWIEGTCAQPKLHWMITAMPATGFFSVACNVKKTRPAWIAPIATSIPAPVVIEAPPAPNPQLLLAKPVPPEPHRPFYKNPWIWAGTGAAILTAVLIIQANQHHSSPSSSQPTTSEGF